jgi:PAS domain S-box-containing protein
MQMEEELRHSKQVLEDRVRERTAAAEARALALAKSESSLRLQTQLMEAILHSMGEGVVVADVDGRFILFNPAAETILGPARTESTPGSWSDDYGIFYPDAQTPFPAAELPLWKAIRGESTDNCELFVRNAAQGSGCLITVTGRPMFTDAGTLRGGVAVFRDITAQKHAEEQTKASLREKEILLKEIHHRVKNNLQIVCALLDLQSCHTDDRRALEMFKESQARVKSMALIHERLYRSQDLAHVDFAEYVRRLADDLYNAYKISNEEIVLDVDVDVPPMSIDIAIPCGLLINELMSNAFKHAFAEATHGDLRVALHRIDDNTNMLVVADTGALFPGGLDFRTTTSFGLQLVNTLVEQLNGEIELKTDRRTEFTITFPHNALADGRSVT